MLKKILISVLSVLLVMIVATGVFRFAVDICEDYLLPAGGRSTEHETAGDKTVEYLFAVDAAGQAAAASPAAQSSYSSGGSGVYAASAAYCAVIGRSAKEDSYYYTIYDIEGLRKASGTFGGPAGQCVIQDIRTGKDEIRILCEENGLCVSYSISLSGRVDGGAMKIHKKAEFDPRREGETLLKLLLPDENMDYIVAAGNNSAVLYSADGHAVATYAYAQPKTLVTSGVFYDSVLVLCGAASAEDDGHGFSYGAAEAFAADGTSLWNKKILNKADSISSAMECQIKPNGNIAIYGRFFDYSQSDVILNSMETDQFEDFKLFGNGSNYYIYTKKIRNDEGGNVQSSAFITELTPEGGEVSMNVYSALNDFRVPSISQERSLNKMNRTGEFVLTLAQANPADSATYLLNIGGKTTRIPVYIKVLFDVDSSGGLYAYLAENGTDVYRMKYFQSIDDFTKGMHRLRTAMRMKGVLDRVPAAFPWIVVCTVGVILLVAKHYWRSGRGDEKDD